MLVTKKQLIIGSAVAVAGGLVYVLINVNQQNKEIAKIEKAIKAGTGETGTSQDLGKADAFDPTYWEEISKKQKVALLKKDAVKKYSDQIANAPSIWNDDEDAVYTALDRRSKVQISQIADQFAQDNKKRLFDFLNDLLDTSEMDKVSSIVNSKPNY